MREFFIGSFEKLVAVIIVLLVIAVVIGAFTAMGTQGILPGLAVLIGGGLYVILIGGMLYLSLGIYHNTKRTAEGVERLANK